MIETPRLTLLPLTLEQLSLHVADRYRLEQSLGLQRGHREVTEPLLSIITHFTVPRLKDPTNDPLYHTVWIAVDRARQQIVADAKFKGEPDQTGTIEIGYGTYPAFQRQGYMTEMVGGLVRWAGGQPGVRRVVADTDADNVASQKVLEKNGFRLFDRIEELLWWEYVVDEPATPLLTFDERGYLMPYECVSVTWQTTYNYFGRQSERRARLWQQVDALFRRIKQDRIETFAVWLDGSYVSNADEPRDVDIVIFVNKKFSDRNRMYLSQLTEAFLNLDVKWVPLFNESADLPTAIDALETMKWTLLFTSGKTGDNKGFLSITDL